MATINGTEWKPGVVKVNGSQITPGKILAGSKAVSKQGIISTGAKPQAVGVKSVSAGSVGMNRGVYIKTGAQDSTGFIASVKEAAKLKDDDKDRSKLPMNDGAPMSDYDPELAHEYSDYSQADRTLPCNSMPVEHSDAIRAMNLPMTCLSMADSRGKCPKSGCIRNVGGKWRVISNKSGKMWPAEYGTEEKARGALAAYHMRK